MGTYLLFVSQLADCILEFISYLWDQWIKSVVRFHLSTSRFSDFPDELVNCRGHSGGTAVDFHDSCPYLYETYFKDIFKISFINCSNRFVIREIKKKYSITKKRHWIASMPFLFLKEIQSRIYDKFELLLVTFIY